MARGARTKMVKQNIAGMSQHELNDIFNQLLGDRNSLNPEIVMDKFTKLSTSVERVSKLMGSFNRSIYCKVLMNDPYVGEYKHNIEGWIEDCNLLVGNAEGQMVDRYLAMKDHKVVHDCIHICSVLAKYKRFIQSNDNLSDSFLLTSKTKDLCIFPFCQFDIKMLYMSSNIDDSVRKYIMVFLNMVFNITYDISQVIVTPDVDIEQLSSVIVRAISESKKMIPRAGKAFKKIEESVELLKSNFSSYYQDFVSTKDPMAIITGFLSDCQDSSKDDGESVDIELARQFMKITAFYRKRSAGKINDPRVNKLLDILDTTFKQLNIDNAESDSSDDSDADAN